MGVDMLNTGENRQLHYVGLISVGYHPELRVGIVFYRLSCIMFFGVHTKDLCYLGRKWYSR